MKIKYTVFDPAKNITVLVETPVDEKFRRFVASEIMRVEPLAEQVGFVSKSDDTVFLDMTGGEFCGNAVRCASKLTGLQSVYCAGQRIKCDDTTAYLPKGLKGIKHTVVELPSEQHTLDKESMEKRLTDDAIACKAAGLMLLDIDKNILTPLVYVPGAATIFWENSCASGSACVCEYLVNKYNKAISIDLKQPGGILHIESSPEINYIKLSGEIEIISSSEIDIKL